MAIAECGITWEELEVEKKMNQAHPTIQGGKKGPRRLLRAFVICVVVLSGLFIIIVTGAIFSVPAMTIYQADEGFKHARRTIDPEELRQWARQSITKHAKDHEIPALEIPNYIVSLYSHPPEAAIIGQASDGQPIVIILWGGGFFHWVMEIGDTNFSEPFVNEGTEYTYNFEWTNGIYYSREARWKLW